MGRQRNRLSSPLCSQLRSGQMLFSRWTRVYCAVRGFCSSIMKKCGLHCKDVWAQIVEDGCSEQLKHAAKGSIDAPFLQMWHFSDIQVDYFVPCKDVIMGTIRTRFLGEPRKLITPDPDNDCFVFNWNNVACKTNALRCVFVLKFGMSGVPCYSPGSSGRCPSWAHA